MKRPDKLQEAQILRQKAEKSLKEKSQREFSNPSEEDVQKLIHELQVHQIELEMQNDELIKAKAAQQIATEKYSDFYDFAPCGYFTLSKEGNIEDMNLHGAEMLGKGRDYLKSSNFGFFVSDDTKPIFSIFREKVFKSKGKETCEVVLSALADQPINVLLIGIATNQEQCMVTAVNINELTLAKNKAQESDRLKSTFLANMSHEIRTPLNGILGFSEILKKPNLTSEKQQEYIGMIEKSGERLLNIINSIISISEIESGCLKAFVSEANVNEQMEFIYHFFKPLAEKKGIQISFIKSLAENESIIKTDVEKVYAILTNLVNNAIKFSHHGSVEFGCSLKPADSKKAGAFSALFELEFFVKDMGIGIPNDRLSMIFERFRQVEESLARNYEGTGLGLSISKAYVEVLGGKLWVESELGKGSTFYFTLPYNSAKKAEVIINSDLFDDVEKHVKKLKMVIAEDDEASRQMLALLTATFANDVIQVNTGTDAVEACRNNPDIDLILMDVQMPVMNGYEATRQIRQFNKDVVIIAQTAFAMTGSKKEAMDAGCNDYISKPIKFGKLLELIRRHIKN